MQQLSNLEILAFRNNKALNVHIPFDAIAQLTKLKALVVEHIQWANNTEIPASICNLRQMIYFEISFMVNMDKIPIECISTHWNDVVYVNFEAFPLVTHDFNPKFW